MLFLSVLGVLQVETARNLYVFYGMNAAIARVWCSIKLP